MINVFHVGLKVIEFRTLDLVVIVITMIILAFSSLLWAQGLQAKLLAWKMVSEMTYVCVRWIVEPLLNLLVSIQY